MLLVFCVLLFYKTVNFWHTCILFWAMYIGVKSAEFVITDQASGRARWMSATEVPKY